MAGRNTGFLFGGEMTVDEANKIIDDWLDESGAYISFEEDCVCVDGFFGCPAALEAIAVVLRERIKEKRKGINKEASE